MALAQRYNPILPTVEGANIYTFCCDKNERRIKHNVEGDRKAKHKRFSPVKYESMAHVKYSHTIREYIIKDFLKNLLRTNGKYATYTKKHGHDRHLDGRQER